MILIFFLLFLISKTPTLAVQEFNLDQEINYQINSVGDATVNQNLTLTNNYSEIYPQNYQVKISSENILNITSNDDSGNIIENTKTENGQSIINLKFNQNNIGKNQQTNFTLNYNSLNFATKKGNIWEVNLPEFKDLNENDSIKINITLPSSFGNLSFSSISPQNSSTLNEKTKITFETDSIKNKKIFLIFGDYQLFDFNLKYFIENDKSYKHLSEIAIPPETDNQKITYRKISPPPQNIKIDDDGNWLAQYQLEANQELEINISGQAKIIHSNKHQSNIDVHQYLKEDTFWPTSNPNLTEIAQNLKSPKDIYSYVVNTLNYNYSNLDYATRQGAENAINFPNQSLCTEFTDLFITLARINGIPAREVEGFAYSNNSKVKPINQKADILHAWPQYYDFDQKAWISIDPTWGKTTSGIDFFSDLDPNHFAFVFHGINSQQPFSPGFYKSKNIKTIDVQFASKEIISNYFPLEIETTKDKFYSNPKLKITNPNFNSINQIIFSTKKPSWQEEIKVITPLSSTVITLPKTINRKIKISINSINSSPTDIYIKNPNFYFNLLLLFAMTITLTGISGIIINRKKQKK